MGQPPLVHERDFRLLGEAVIKAALFNDPFGLLVSVVMITGDNNNTAAAVAKQVGIDNVISKVLPGEKQEKVAALQKFGSVAMVGDGINDAPVLSLADVGISMGSIGSDSAVEASDIVIMDDNLKGLIRAFKVSGNTNKIAKENIYFALTVKAVVLILGALGLANMWLAVFADVGVSVIAIINSLRVLNTKKIK